MSTTDTPAVAETWGAELRATTKLAVPLAVAFGGNQLLSLTDTIVAGRMGESELAAVGLGATVLYSVMIFPMGVLLGIDPLISQARGAGEPEEAARWTRVARRLVGWMTPATIAITVLFMAGSLAFSDFTAEEKSDTWTYLLVRSISVWPFLWLSIQRSTLQAWDLGRPIAIAMVVANLVNVPASVLLGFGDAGLVALGLPAIGLGDGWGVGGIATATVLVYLAQIAVLEGSVRRLPALQRVTDAPPGAWRSIWKQGWPIGLQYTAEVMLFGGSAMVMAVFGATAVAAHQVALQLTSFSFTMCLGIGAAAAVRCGLATGRGDQPGLRRAGVLALGLGAAVMGISAVCYLVLRRPMTELVTDVPAVVELASTLLVFAVVFQVFDGLQAVGASILRGVGDTRAAMRIALVGYWGVALPTALLMAFPFGFGPEGIWYGLVAGLLVTGCAMSARFFTVSGPGRLSGPGAVGVRHEEGR